jgi:hypothetical protein
LVFALGRAANAGDALAIGYNKDGVWTAVTYYCSSTAKGGSDYKTEAEAKEEALKDLKKRAPEGLEKSTVFSSSDRTGHFAYARGKNADDKDFHAVGFGASKEAAEKDAFEQLKRAGGTNEQKVIYSYFSHGADEAAAKK